MAEIVKNGMTIHLPPNEKVRNCKTLTRDVVIMKLETMIMNLDSGVIYTVPKACRLENIHPSQIYAWKHERFPDDTEVCDLIEELYAASEAIIVEEALKGKISHQFARFYLANKFDYSDKQTIDVNSTVRNVDTTPKPITMTIKSLPKSYKYETSTEEE